MTTRLPYGRHTFYDDDVAAVGKVLRGAFVATGSTVATFERTLGRAVNAPGTVACSSGTAAVHLVAMSIGLGPGDAAVAPATTFLASANAVRMTGAEVLLADIDPDTGLMRADHFDATIGSAGDRRVCAMFPVHYCPPADSNG